MTSNIISMPTGGRFLEYDEDKVRDIKKFIERIRDALKV